MSTLNLKDALSEKEKEFNMSDDIFGMTLLTNPGYISSPRAIMFTSHLRQFTNLVNPDFPRVFTNYENVFGKHSTGYYKAKSNLKIINKISRFENGDDDDHLYLLFVYDESADRYDIIEKKVFEDLTEKFGYGYNTEKIDKAKKKELLEEIDLISSSSNPLSMLIRARQATGYTGILSSSVQESAKLDRLEEIVQTIIEDGEKAVIFSNWTSITDEIVNRLNKYSPLVITGETKDSDRQVLVNEFQTNDKNKIIIV